MEKLVIQNGIIANDVVGGIPFKRRIVARSGSLANVRTGQALTGPIGITVHNTGNAAPTAGALNHAAWLQSVENDDSAYIGVHFFVDAEVIVQTLPITEVSWHAGDGRGQGNTATISVEICETSPYEKCEANAKVLCASLLTSLGLNRLFTHQMWNGKYCPHLILDRPNGWTDFCSDVNRLMAAAAMPAQAAPVLDNAASAWAQEAVDWALANRVLVGDTNGDLALHRALTREEAMVFLQRLVKGRALS